MTCVHLNANLGLCISYIWLKILLNIGDLWHKIYILARTTQNVTETKKNRSILLVKIEYSKEMKCLYFLETIDNL